MEGTIRGGASRQVAAAIASALFRSALLQDQKGDLVSVDVPDVAADGITVVAAFLATQRFAGAFLGQGFRNAGQAYEAIRQVLPGDLACDARQVDKAANRAKHGSGHGGKSNMGRNLVTSEVRQQETASEKFMGLEVRHLGFWLHDRQGEWGDSVHPGL